MAAKGRGLLERTVVCWLWASTAKTELWLSAPWNSVFWGIFCLFVCFFNLELLSLVLDLLQLSHPLQLLRHTHGMK